MSIHVNDFQWEEGKNDLQYIRLLEKTLANERAVTGKAVSKIGELSRENEELRNRYGNIKFFKYCLQVKDILRASEYTLDYNTEEELRDAYKKYEKDTDYDIVGMYAMSMETRPIEKAEVL